MNQQESVLAPVTDLSNLFPDIQGQLCSRHSTLLGKLRQTFNKLYDGFQPQYYVVVKGITKIMNNNQISLEMALQNGIVLLVSKTYKNTNIFFNGNHSDEQLIFDPSGTVLEGLHEWSQELSTVMKVATQDIPQVERFGGIFYVHANIPQNMFQYKTALLTSIFLGILTINNKLPQYSTQKLIELMSQSAKIASEQQLQQYFYDFQNRKFSLNVGNNHFQIPLDGELKLLFCRLDLAMFDIQHNRSSRKLLEQKKENIVTCLKKKFGINSIYQAFQEEVRLNKSELPGDKQQSQSIIQLQMKELDSVCQFSNKQITVQKLLQLKWQIDSQVKNIYTPEVIDLVQNLKLRTDCQACAIVQGQFLMMAVNKQKFPELICLLRQLLHKGELKSKSCFRIQQGLVQNRWSQDLEIGQKIFASAPSKGVGIFDPKEAIWFD